MDKKTKTTVRYIWKPGLTLVVFVCLSGIVFSKFQALRHFADSFNPEALAQVADNMPRPPAIPASNPDFQAGYLNVNLYNGIDGLVVDPTGNQDSTAGLQRAINDGISYGLTVYLPEGATYKVSDTLTGIQPNGPESSCEDHIWSPGPYKFSKAPSLVGSSHGARPKIILANNSPGFNNSDDKKAVIFFKNEGTGQTEWADPYYGDQICGFFFVISNINIELGSGNSGAVGITAPSAQYSYIENVSINATGAYAGIDGPPCTDGVINVSVEGGQYGIISWGTGSSWVGVSLTNQTSAAILGQSHGGDITVTGFKIVKASGPAIILIDAWGVEPELTLIDGTMEIGGSALAINNSSGRDVYINNVYFKGSAPIIKSGSDAAVTSNGAGIWDRIVTYSYTDKRSSTQCNPGPCVTVTSHNIVNGVTGQNTIQNISRGVDSPGELMTRHLPGPIPDFKSPGVGNLGNLGIIGDDVTDQTSAINAQLNNYEYVFVPRGNFQITGELNLKANTKVFGVPGGRSRIVTNNWNPNGQYLYALKTPNDIHGTAYIGDIRVSLPSDSLSKTYIGALDWQVGKNSIVRQFYPFPDWVQSDYATMPRKFVHIRNGGGGRWYGLMIHFTQSRTQHDDFRSLLVEGTSQPLTFYACNPEHSRGITNIEFKNAQNVRLIGTKGEPMNWRSTLWITNSNNIFVGGMMMNSPANTIKVENSTNVEIANIHGYVQSTRDTARYMLREINSGVVGPSIDLTKQVSLYRKGNFDASVFGTAESPPPSSTNLLQNPSFESGETSWSFFNDASSDQNQFSIASSGMSRPNAAKISLSQISPSNPNIQLNQKDITLKPNTSYRLTFDAYSNTGHDITFHLHKDTSPYTNYGLNNHLVQLNTDWQSYAIDFTTPNFPTEVNDGRLRIWFPGEAQPNDEFYFDNFNLVEYAGEITAPANPSGLSIR